LNGFVLGELKIMQLSWLAGGWHGREGCGFQGFQEAGLRLRTDNSGNRLSPSGSSLVAANYVWQDYDMFPNFPALKDFLAFWETTLEGPLFAVTVAHSKLIKPAELRAVDGVFRLH
jgi:uncharacterized protein Usg